jgi:hypothetical protein
MVVRRHLPNYAPDCRSVDNPSVLFGSLAVLAFVTARPESLALRDPETRFADLALSKQL